MSGYDPYSLVVSKAGSVISEGLPVSLGPGGSSITPASVTALVGIAQGGALQKAPAVTQAIAKILSAASDAYAANNTSLGDSLTSAANNIESSGDSLVAGGPGEFVQRFQSVQTHIADSVAIKTVTAAMSNTDFGDLGSGITNISSMSTQGINSSVGSVTAAADVFSKMGSAYDLTDIGNFGTGGGLVSRLAESKLANVSGVNSALEQAGVELTDVKNPLYATTVNRVLGSITDSATISEIQNQFDLNPATALASLADFTDATKIVGAAASAVTGGVGALAAKFKDLGASFSGAEQAAGLLNNIEIPEIPALDTKSLSALAGDAAATVDSLTGTGEGPLGVPSMNNFMTAVAGGPEIDAILENAVTLDLANSANAAVNSANTLLAKVNIDTVPPRLSTIAGFAGNLHRLGADALGSGTAAVLENMATADQYGDAIKASLAEGKNNALLQSVGIKPLSIV